MKVSTRDVKPLNLGRKTNLDLLQKMGIAYIELSNGMDRLTISYKKIRVQLGWDPQAD